MQQNDRLTISLFILRLGVFVVMFIWTIDKFVRPEHAAAVFKNFYFISDLNYTLSYLIGAVELVLLAGFLLGWKKRFTYCAVLILHAVSTLSSFKQYLAPFEGPNILFFAAWPMLAACVALYLLREQDTLWTIEKS